MTRSKREQTQPQIRMPKAGDRISESMMQGLVRGVNHYNEGLEAHPSTYLRQAITCKDDENNYPLKSAQPIAYPFKWYSIHRKESAPAGETVEDLPIRAADRAAYWEAISRSETEPDGWAFNPTETHKFVAHNFATPPDKLLDYIDEGTVVWVAFLMGTYQMLRPEIDRYYFKATSNILPANINASNPELTTYNAGDCHIYTLGQTATATVFSPVQLKNSAGTALVRKVINPSASDTISTGDQFWGARWAGGVFVATIWVC